MSKQPLIYLLSCLIILLSWTSSQARNIQYEEYVYRADIVPFSTSIELEDPRSQEPQVVGGQQQYVYASRTAFVRLVYGRADLKDITGVHWTYQVDFEIEDLDGGNPPQQESLTIEYSNNGGVWEAMKRFDDMSGHVRVNILGVTPTNLNGSPIDINDPAEIWDIRLELGYDIERYDYFDASQVSTLQINTSYPHEMGEAWTQLVWTPQEGAEAYDLEWVFWDDENQDVVPTDDDVLFENATRVRLTNHWYEIEAIYPKGTLYFRVRGVGRFIYGAVNGDYSYIKNGAWTTNRVSRSLNPGFETDRNWQYQVVFAEDGKNKKSISYYDKSMRVRQAQTMLSTEGRAMIGEEFYDVEGRVTLSVLPAPATRDPEVDPALTSLYYRTHDMNNPNATRFNVNTSGSDYNRMNYDKLGMADQLGTASGAGFYFSPANNLPVMYRDYIPDAQGYAFTQTKLKRDGTGRPVESGGVGQIFQPTQDHSTKTAYGGAAQSELGRLFGPNVGKASHYKKVLSTDANGQMSVSYMDMGGQTIATTLVGDKPDNVQDIGGSGFNVNRDIMAQNLVNYEDGFISQTSDEILNVAIGEAYNFRYEMDGEIVNVPLSYTMPDGSTVTLTGQCLTCEYELDINILDPDGINVYSNSQTISPSEACVDDAAYQVNFTINFNKIGTYRVTKELKLANQSVDDLLNSLANSGNLPSLSNLQDYFTSQIDLYACSYTCEQYCETKIAQEFPSLDPASQSFKDKVASCVTNDCGEWVGEALTSNCDGLLSQMIVQLSPGGIYYDGSESANFISTVTTTSPSYTDLSDLDFVVKLPGQPDQTINGMANYPGTSTPFSTYLFDASQWQPQWSETLAEAHREYCHYTECQLNIDSKHYDIRLKNLASWSAAMNTSIPDVTPTTYYAGSVGDWNSIMTNDPYYQSLSTTLKGNYSSMLSNYLSSGSNIFSQAEQICTNAGIAAGADVRFHIFIGMYTEAKMKFMQDNSSCTYYDDSWAIVIENPILNLATADDIWDLINAQGSTSSGNICTVNVDSWMAAITTDCGTNLTAQEEIEVRQYLMAYCMSGMSGVNPLGVLLADDLATGNVDDNLAEVIAILSGCSNLNNIAVSANTVYEPVDPNNCHMVNTPSTSTCFSELIANLNYQVFTLGGHSLPNGSCYSGANIVSDALVINSYTGAQGNTLTNFTLAFIKDGTTPVLYDISDISEVLWVTATSNTGTSNIIVGGVTWLKTDIQAGIKLTNGNIVSVEICSNYCAGPHCGFYTVALEDCARLPLTPTSYTISWADIIDDCIEQYQAQANLYAQAFYDKQIDELLSQMMSVKGECLSKDFNEEFRVNYFLKEYHYTLYYYDQAGSLIATVPPAGIDPYPTSDFDADGNYIGTEQMRHKLATRYVYNSIGEFIKTVTPDDGTTLYFYDFAGRIRLIQDEKQTVKSSVTTNIYHFTKYDKLGRVIENGQINDYENSSSSVNLIENDINKLNFPSNTYDLEQLTYTAYDDADNIGSFSQKNLLNRVSKIWNDNITTRYSYDEHGNILALEQTSNNLGTKLFEYDYDVISEKVNQFIYQKGSGDQFYTQYDYDADNRITHVYTSDDGYIFDIEARYFYYTHGLNARVELGHDKVQGLDLYQNIQGNLKGVNMPNDLSATTDPGQDGNSVLSLINQYVAKDEMAFVLGYHQGDFHAINTNVTNTVNGNYWSDLSSEILSHKNGQLGLFNGNIAFMITDIRAFNDNVNIMSYKYDQLHRITEAKSAGWNGNSNIWVYNNNYNTNYSYDGNGNIRNLKRYARINGTATLIDDISYQYETSGDYLTNNQLESVSDIYNGGQGDITGTNAFTYDKTGNLTSNLGEDIEEITWSRSGKVLEVKYVSGSGKNDIIYSYDGNDNRIKKSISDSENTTYHYSRDPFGKIIALYKEVTETIGGNIYRNIYLDENPLNGGKRLGVMTFGTSRLISSNKISGSGLPILATYEESKIERERGWKRYELSNHLENVLVVVSDVVVGIGSTKANYYKASVVSAADYYPFGWNIPDRKILSSGVYRYGFNGMEKDDEITTEGGTYTTHFRMYDSRLGRWYTIDPVTHEWESPYSAMHNSPILLNDPDGDCPTCITAFMVGIFSEYTVIVGEKYLFGDEDMTFEKALVPTTEDLVQIASAGGAAALTGFWSGVPTSALNKLRRPWVKKFAARLADEAVEFGADMVESYVSNRVKRWLGIDEKPLDFEGVLRSGLDNKIGGFASRRGKGPGHAAPKAMQRAKQTVQRNIQKSKKYNERAKKYAKEGNNKKARKWKRKSKRSKERAIKTGSKFLAKTVGGGSIDEIKKRVTTKVEQGIYGTEEITSDGLMTDEEVKEYLKKEATIQREQPQIKQGGN